MDLNEVINISQNSNYDSKSAGKRAVSSDDIPVFSGSLDEQIDSFDELVFGNSNLDESTDNSFHTYDASAELKQVTNMFTAKDLQNSKLPESIKREMANNPLILKSTIDPQMTELENRLIDSGVAKSMGIIKDLEKMDRQKLNEQKQMQAPKNNGGTNIDYSYIKHLIREAIDEKFSQFGNLLTESKDGQSNSLYVMKLGKKFLFLDDEDNVFECEMVYKGKNKAKKRK